MGIKATYRIAYESSQHIFNHYLLRFFERTKSIRPMNIVNKIKDIFRIKYIVENAINSPEANIQQQIRDLKKSVVAERLKYLAINSTSPGISSDKLCDKEVVVSLTSYGQRIHEVWLTIESIMQGTIKPNRIILWLGDENKFKFIPIGLKRQQERGLEIRYCKDIRSYTKLIPSLKSFPEACIVTIDDDVMYEPDLLEHLVSSYLENPDVVSACRIHKMKKNQDNQLMPYMSWEHFSYFREPSFMNFLTGNGGVLYPPHCFNDEVFNEDVFLDICKYADDVWFQAMLIKNNVKVIKAFTHAANGQDYTSNGSENESCLFAGNFTRNDEQIQSVFEKYQIYERLP